MKDGLFDSLFTFHPSEGKRPLEDFITQGFGWLLSKDQALLRRFIEFLVDRMREPKPVLDWSEANPVVDTQVNFSGGRIDMVITISDPSQKRLLLFEHKVWAPLSEGQLENYREYGRQQGGNYIVVLITANHLQHTPVAGVALVWADVYSFLEEFLAENRSQENAILLEQFLLFLRNQGLSPTEPLSMEQIVSHFYSLKLKDGFSRLIELIHRMDWKRVYEHVPDLRGNKEPQPIEDRWGRFGFSFHSTWEPAIFIGAIYDPRNTAIQPLDINKGPDLVLLLDFYIRDEPRLNRFLGDENYRALVQYLANTSGDIHFLNNYETGENKWRLLVLRKSMADVFRGKTTEKEQVDALYEFYNQCLDLLLYDDLLKRATMNLRGSP